MRQLYGRDEQIASLVALLDALDRLPAAAVIIGEAGIGKTAVWLAAVEEARGASVCSHAGPRRRRRASLSPAWPTSSAASLTSVLRELPFPQRRVLDPALALADAEEVVEQGVLAFAFGASA